MSRWPRRTEPPGLRSKPGPASLIGCFEPLSLPFQPLPCVEPGAAFPAGASSGEGRSLCRGKRLPRLRRGSGASPRPPPPPPSRSRSPARPRVVGSPSAPTPGRGRSTALIQRLCVTVFVSGFYGAAVTRNTWTAAQRALRRRALGCAGLSSGRGVKIK